MPFSPPEPIDDEETGRPRPLFGVGFWIALAFGLVCVIAGLAFAKLGPEYLRARPPS